jgi:RNA polymerase sigma-B factor
MYEMTANASPPTPISDGTCPELAEPSARRARHAGRDGRCRDADAKLDVEALFEAYYATRDRVLRNQLVEAFMYIADFQSRRFASANVARDDIRQAAYVGVVSAVERFDPHLGISFVTFATRTVEGECKRYLRDRTWAVRPPRRRQERYLEVRRAQEELTNERGRVPTVADVAERIDATEEEVLEALEAGSARYGTGIDYVTPKGGITDVLRCDESTRRLDEAEASVLLQRALAQLSPKDRRIIELRYVHRWTESRIADDLGISQSYLSRYVRRLLAELRRSIGAI